MNPVGGRGFGGFGRGGGGGGGRGRRNQFYATGLTGWQRAGMGAGAYGMPPAYPMPNAAPFGPTQTVEQELNALKSQAEYFGDALEEIRKRIEELQASASEKTE
jgi:hypothetical protein